jgi:hypothetical protein
MTPIPAGLRLGYAEPRDAVAAFEQRNLLQPSFRWQDTWQEEHSRALAVAGVQRLDILQVFQDEIGAAVREGRSLADFSKAARQRLVQKGWWGNIPITDPATGEERITRFDDRRLQLIFDVNMRQSQAAGRWQRIERGAKLFPLLMYRTMRDEHVRASHRVWDGLVLPVNHSFWRTHYAPNGWRCRCIVFALNQRDVDRRRAAGEAIQTEAPPIDWISYVNPRTGQVVPVPRGIDPGFAYNPGQARDGAFFDQALGKALTASPLAGAVAVAQATADHHMLLMQAVQQWGEWVDGLVADLDHPASAGRNVGTLPVGAMRALVQRGVPPTSAVLGVQAADAQRTLQAGAEPALYRRLPALLAAARAALLVRGSQPSALVLVVDLTASDGSVSKLAVQVLAARVNLVRGLSVVPAEDLRNETTYELLWGSIE